MVEPTRWEYATIPLIVRNAKGILDQWGEEGYMLVTVVPGPNGSAPVAYMERTHMQKSHQPMWEYETAQLTIHSTKAALDRHGEDGWELVTVLPGPDGNAPVAYLKRPKQ